MTRLQMAVQECNPTSRRPDRMDGTPLGNKRDVELDVLKAVGYNAV
jgi:hypothetical protein